MLRLFVASVSLLVTAMAHSEPLRWVIDATQGGEATLVGEMPISEESEQEVYPKLGRALAGTPEGQAYFEYLKALAELRSADAVAMFTSADGSRERFRKELEAQPDRHNGWKDVERVTAKLVFNWGPYKIVNIAIRMQNDPREYLWREALFCTSGCAMSNAFNIMDPNREVFALMNGSSTTALVTRDWQSLADDAKNSGLMNMSEALFYRPGWVPGSLASRYPLIVFPKVEVLTGGFYPLLVEGERQTPGGSVGPAVQALEAFLADLQGVDLTVAPDGSYANEALEKVLGAHWRDFKAGRLFRFFERADDDAPLVLAKYAQHPFANQLSKWAGVRLAGLYESATGVFLFVYPVLDDGRILNMQVLPFERDGKSPEKLALSMKLLRTDAGRLVMSSEMVDWVDRKTESLLVSSR